MSSCYYFAYGSNMNPARMRARGLDFLTAEAARLTNFVLCFNKEAHNNPGVAYANVVPAHDQHVEGVLYRLRGQDDIALMDHYEGTPVRYSREVLSVQTIETTQNAWVYMANPADITRGLLPQSRYIQHLLAGAEFLSEGYLEWLQQQPCHQVEDGCPQRGLQYND